MGVDPGADSLDPGSLDPGDVGTIEDVSDPNPGGIDEVVITVDRRRKNLQDYSGTAAAFSSTQLTNLGINNVTSLSQVVPGLQIGINDQGSSTVYIRGVGSDNTTELGDPAVAVHLDNVYLPRVRGLNAAYLDVERVEVNSGPQGTVRGRNATGGSVNIISRPAVYGEYQAYAEMTIGTYHRREYQGMVNVPLGDSLALRVAAASTSIDPTWENVGPLDHLPGAQDTNDYALKGQLRFKPAPGLDITLAGDYTLSRGAGYTGINLQNGFQRRIDVNNTPNTQADDVLTPIDPDAIDNPRQVWQRGRYPESSLTHWGVRLNATYDAGPVNFELLGSYRFQDWILYGGSNAGYFAPGTPDNTLLTQQWDNWSFAQQQHNDSESWVGEFRVASPDDQQFVWSVGAFGFYEDQGAFLGQVTADPGGFNEFNMPSTVGYSYAGYADATFKVTDTFRVLAGIRYSWEHKDRLGGLWMIGNGLPTNGNTLCAAQNNMGVCTQPGLANNGIGRFGTEGFRFRGLERDNYDVPTSTATVEERVNFFLDGIESFGVRDQAAIALCNDVPAEGFTDAAGNVTVGNPQRIAQDAEGHWRCVNGVRSSVPADFTNPRAQNGEADDDYADWKVGVEYDVVKDSMLYATLSSGHKASGFNDSFPDPDRPGEYLTPDYGAEEAYSLEIGAKNQFLDKKLRVNAAAFAYLYSDLQFQTILTVGTAPPIDPNTGMIEIDPLTNMPFVDTRGGAAARQNAKETATAYGLDVDVVYALPWGFEADVHALVMDARFPDKTYVNDDRLGLGTEPAEVDIGGNWLPRVSPYTLNYSLSQIIFTAAGTFDWIIQGQTRGPHFFNAFNGDGKNFEKRGPGWGINPITGEPDPIENVEDPAGAMLCMMYNNTNTCQQYTALANNIERFNDRVPTYTTVNISLGWKRTDGMMSIRGFVNNVFDTVYPTNIISQSGFHSRFYNDPRMAGVRMRLDF